ncbi:MAG: hypothetical protein J0H14_22195 [Alphaproteobacteria bacterium]|jgi:hypothetical protein|nr:hypothetical protein [Alphaproteobacteria bacterium]
MPNLDTIAAQDWLRALHPGHVPPDWPPPIRAIEEPAVHARALVDLGDDLDQLASRADGSLHARLADPATLDELRTLLCQMGAARLLALMHFLAENAEPGSAPLPVVLSRAETAEALALRSALRALSRRFTLQRMFSPERLSALRTAIADANKEAFQ